MCKEQNQVEIAAAQFEALCVEETSLGCRVERGPLRSSASVMDKNGAPTAAPTTVSTFGPAAVPSSGGCQQVSAGIGLVSQQFQGLDSEPGSKRQIICQSLSRAASKMGYEPRNGKPPVATPTRNPPQLSDGCGL